MNPPRRSTRPSERSIQPIGEASAGLRALQHATAATAHERTLQRHFEEINRLGARLQMPRVQVVARVRALKSVDPDVAITISGGLNRPPYAKTPAIAALFDHAKGLAAEIGFDLQDLKTGGGSDGNFCADLAPVLDGLGVDGKGGHTGYEQCYISSLVPRATLMHRLLETLK
jgi:acetylornithine deacetylase/succinyl-diaminopimelate desuccinylase-like protein